MVGNCFNFTVNVKEHTRFIIRRHRYIHVTLYIDNACLVSIPTFEIYEEIYK